MSQHAILMDGTALCLACGFCCEGTLHTHTILQPDETARLAGLGVTVGHFRGRAGFHQPCPLHRQDRCTAYEARPLVCRSYECALFKRHVAGEVTLADAQQIVSVARGLRDRLQAHSPEHRSFRGLLNALLEMADAGPPGMDPVAHPLDDEQVLATILALAMHLHKHFDEPVRGSWEDL